MTTGTLLQDTRYPLQVWFQAIWYITGQKYGASALGLQRVLGLGSYHIFCWVEPLTGRHQVHVTTRRTAAEFAEKLRLLVEEVYPDARKIVLVTDNLNTHQPGSHYERFTPGEARRTTQRLEGISRRNMPTG